MGVSQRAHALCAVYEAHDVGDLAALLTEHVLWGGPAFPDSQDACHNREVVLAWDEGFGAQEVGTAGVTVMESELPGALGLSLTGPPGRSRRVDGVRCHEGGRVTQIYGTDDRTVAVAIGGRSSVRDPA